MERRRPRNKQQAQCGADRARRARRLRAATPPRRGQPVHGPGSKASDEANNNAVVVAAAANGAAAQIAEKPLPENATMRCAFGATRAGGLLGRVRLHLQTDRFLAARRDDALWEAGCLLASIALGNLVAELSEDEMKMPLSGQAQRAPLGNAASGIVGGGVHCPLAPCGASRPVAPGGVHRSDAPAAAAPGATAQSGVAR